MKASKLAKIVGLAAFLTLTSPFAFAGVVRTIQTNSKTMAPVFLRMGQSTVLRFLEKPKKVILGNSNYYSIEFVENDLAIQPLGAVTTNLFVYSQSSVYGFILRTNQGLSYDDIVQVSLKKLEPESLEIFGSVLKVVSTPLQKLKFGTDARVILTKVSKSSSGQLYVFDLSVENMTNSKLTLHDVQIELATGGKQIEIQETVFKDFELGSKQSTSIRILANLKSRTDVSIQFAKKRLKLRDTIQRKLL